MAVLLDISKKGTKLICSLYKNIFLNSEIIFIFVSKTIQEAEAI